MKNTPWIILTLLICLLPPTFSKAENISPEKSQVGALSHEISQIITIQVSSHKKAEDAEREMTRLKGLDLNVFKDYEPDNLLYLQAYRETFEHQLEEGRLRLALERIARQEIIWKPCLKPTPFSFPIITDRLREKLSSEKLADRIRKMTAILTR